MTMIAVFAPSEIPEQLDQYPDRTVVRVNWKDGKFGLLLVEELKIALLERTVFGVPPEQIESLSSCLTVT